ncbi:RNA-directed DNA polymerase, eukaryota [Tanacetum coccineum]
MEEEDITYYWPQIEHPIIPKTSDAKYVSDYRPISLIGSVYKVVTKILATRLAPIIPDIISDTQSAFLAKRNILDGPFILNELLSWCKKYNKQAMFFKVDFAKAFDCVRWDYLLDVMKSFGFGPNWCRWIQGTLSSARASVLVNGSPTDEFSFYRGLKQGDPLSPFLFILIMESLHLSMIRASSNGLFRGLCLNGSLSVSHLFYADDAMFIGEWSQANLENVIKMLQCFQAASGLSINIQKSNLLGVGVGRSEIDQAADNIGCLVMNNRFRYLGVMVGDLMNRKAAWVEVINKLRARLSNWKVKTLSIGGRYTLLKSVLGSSPLYHMSIFKTPKGVLKEMEGIRSKFFNGNDPKERKITWVAWQKVLASKVQGGLGVSSFFALNRALLIKWYWRFLSNDGSLWSHVIQAIHGDKLDVSFINGAVFSFCGIGLGLLFMHYNDDKRAIRQGQCKNDGCSSRNGPVIGGPFKLIDPNGKLATDKVTKENGNTSSVWFYSSLMLALCNPEFDVAKAGRKRFMIFADKSVLKVHIPEVLPDVVKEECLILVTTNVNEETGTIEIKQETVKEKIHDKKEDDITKRKKDVSQYSTMDTVLDESTIDFEPQEYIIPSSSSTILLKQTLILKRRYEIISLLDGVSLHEYASSGLKPTCENDVLCRK